jgi:DHA2 family multidrug resistance protein-like MFS transporter
MGVPVMVLLLILGPLLLPEYRDPNPGRLDLISAALSLIAVLSVIFGLKQIAQEGVQPSFIFIILFGLAVGAYFVYRQRILADPLLDLRLFQVREFSVSLVTYTLGVFVAFGSFLFIAQYLQLVLGLSPLNAGLWSLPGAIANIVGSNLAPVLVRRSRTVVVVAGGLALAAVGFGMISQAGVDSLPIVVIGWTLISLGFGATFTLTADLVVGSAPPEKAGAAAALSETGAEFGGALGLAVLGSLGLAIYRSQLAGALPSGISPEAALVAEETLAGAVATAAQLPEQIGAALLTVAREAFVHGLQVTAIFGAVGFAFLAILVALTLQHVGKNAESKEAEPSHRQPTVRPKAEIQVGD